MKRFFVAIEELYGRVTEALPTFEGNPCGDCRSCCTVRMKTHRVSRLEFDFLSERIGADRVAEFRRFIHREKDDQGEHVFPVCPLLDERGCSVHAIRPYSCRLYGHVRNDRTELLAECVFRGHERVVPWQKERQLLPEHLELIELVTDYSAYFLPPDEEIEPVAEPLIQTELDLAMDLQVKGEYRAARDIVHTLIQKQGEKGLFLQMLGETSEALKEYEEALIAFGKAAELTPDNPELQYRIGCNHFWLQRYDESATHLLRALEIDPDRSRTVGFLGFVRQFQGRSEEARDLYRRSVERETQPGPYRFQLGYIQEMLADYGAAKAAYRSALEFEPTKNMAEQALARLSIHSDEPL